MAPDLPDPTNADEVMNDLSPEVREGPLGIPVVAPKGAPDLPGTSRSGNSSMDDLY